MNLKYLKHLAKQGESFIHPGGYAATQLLIEKLDIQSEDKILEIGCGTGATLVEIASRYDNQIYGVDILDEMLSAARERIKQSGCEDKISVQKAGADKPLSFKSNSFDKIYMESVVGFQEINAFKQILSETHRLLKHEGLYIASEALWKDNVSDDVVKEICESSERDFGLAHASASNITLSKFLSLANENGFKELEVLPLDTIQKSPSEKMNAVFSKKKKKKILLLPLNFLNLYEELKYKAKLNKHKNEGKYLSSYVVVFRSV